MMQTFKGGGRPAAMLLLILLSSCRAPSTGEGPPADAAAGKSTQEAQAPQEDPRQVLKGRVYAVTLDARGGGKTLFVGAAAGLIVYDVSDGSRPRELSAVFLPGSVTSIVQEGNLLLASTGPDGVAVIDVEKRENPEVRSVVKTPGGAWKAVMAGGKILAVADGSMGVTLMEVQDVRDMGGAAVAGVWETKDYVRDIAVEKEGGKIYLYAAAGREGIVLLDATSPGSPAFLSALDTGGEIRAVVLDGGRVLAAAGEKGLAVAEREGSALRLLSRFDPSATDLVRGVAAGDEGKMVYLAAGQAGLVMADISDLKAIGSLGVFEYTKSLGRVAVDGGTAYVAADAGGLLVLDVSGMPAVKILYPPG